MFSGGIEKHRYMEWVNSAKVGLSFSKKNLFHLMKNAFYLILEALFVLKIFKFLS